MNTHRIFLGFIIAGAVACASQTKPPASAGGGGSAIPAAGGSAQPQVPVDLGPEIPKDARWTIFCHSFTGPNHVIEAKAFRDYLMRGSRMRDWYIVHSENETTLYYGFYRSIDELSENKDDRKDAARKQADLQAVSAMINPNTGARMFRMVFVTPLEGPDPNAPAEWNLANVKGNAYYTLQICVYKDSPVRKEYAVDAVREARKAGVEAYYYHGPTGSSVCVGLWPQTAVQAMTEVHAQNPSDALVTIHSDTEAFNTPAGRDGVEVVKNQSLAIDPGLRAMLQKFPWHHINGKPYRTLKDPRTGQLQNVQSHSFLVVVPNARQREVDRGASPILNLAPPSIGAAPAETTPDPFKPRRPVTPPPAGGRLRSLDD